MTETVDPPSKPKRIVRSYTPEQRVNALELFASGMHQPAISAKLGIPVQTLSGWFAGSGFGQRQGGMINDKVKESLNKVVAKVTKKASAEVQDLLDQSVHLGMLVLTKARLAVSTCNGRKHVGALLQASTAAKTGIAIARQALGLNDTTESVIVRVDLVGKVNQSEPIDITPACGVATPTLALTQSTPDTTSEKKQ